MTFYLNDSLGRGSVLQTAMDDPPFSGMDRVQDHLWPRAGQGGTPALGQAG